MIFDELLNNDNQWLCEDINKKIDAKKQIKIWSMPKILIVIFKRFRNNGSKINSFINFPVDNLDLSKYHNLSQKRFCLFCLLKGVDSLQYLMVFLLL